MKILIGCEISQVVLEAFTKKGHDVNSCDVKPCAGHYPEKHIQDDIRNVIKSKHWEMFICHPPCTYLTIRAIYWNKLRDRRTEVNEAVRFFYEMYFSDFKYIAIENPVGIMSTMLKKPDFIIQPSQFGDIYMKKTCFWLRNLPPLLPTHCFQQEKPTYIGKTGRKYYWHEALPKNIDRAQAKATTFKGIAEAMAAQWT